MKIFACALAVVALLAFGSSASADQSASCPNDIILDDSAWVLRAIQTGGSADAGGYAYMAWKRVFAYQPDAAKRFRKEFFPACFAETYSFVIGGRQQQIAKRVVSPSGSRAFLLLSDNTWAAGSNISVVADLKNSTDPAYYVLLFRASEPAVHRKVVLPLIFPSPSFRSER